VCAKPSSRNNSPIERSPETFVRRSRERNAHGPFSAALSSSAASARESRDGVSYSDIFAGLSSIKVVAFRDAGDAKGRNRLHFRYMLAEKACNGNGFFAFIVANHRDEMAAFEGRAHSVYSFVCTT
jgi:hypothetical protein